MGEWSYRWICFFHQGLNIWVFLWNTKTRRVKENSPPFLAGRSPTPFCALHFIKRQPLQEITHLLATNANAQSVYNGRRMSSVAERRRLLEQTSGVGNKKRKSPNLSHDNNISSSNLKRPLLRRDLR
ncbi:hypothetical protein SUGI_0394030 [Cryptomeria japonica]|nr:hypothetical protein SUGI_0394030 [Cryptomeria japonica]